jgi:hypothetical protein
MSPERIRADDQIVNVISRWLARHISDAELSTELQRADLAGLSPEQAEAVAELRNGLQVGADRPGLEMIARETVEAVALWG